MGFRKGSGKILACLQRRATGKNLHFELKMFYLCLKALVSALQEVFDAPHPFPAILSVVETRNGDHCQIFEQG